MPVAEPTKAGPAISATMAASKGAQTKAVTPMIGAAMKNAVSVWSVPMTKSIADEML